MPTPTVLISIEALTDVSSVEVGRKFMKTLCEVDPRLQPEQVAFSEEYKDPFISIDDFAENWWRSGGAMTLGDRYVGEAVFGPFWRRKSGLTNRGFVKHADLRDPRYLIPSTVWFQSRWNKIVDFERLFEGWVKLTSPDIGMLHLFTEPEQGRRDSNYKDFQLGYFGRPEEGVPNLGWAMVFGERYDGMYDKSGIVSAGYSVSELGNATIIRVTDKLGDVFENFDNFSLRRANLRSYFRPDFCWIPNPGD